MSKRYTISARRTQEKTDEVCGKEKGVNHIRIYIWRDNEREARAEAVRQLSPHGWVIKEVSLKHP